jgi:arginine repressor
MLRERDRQVLEIINRQLLIRKEELKRQLRSEGFDDGISIANRLMELGYVKFIEAVGTPCYTITQSGMKILKD